MTAEIVMLSPGEIVPYEDNPRLNDGSVDYVAASIRDFGFRSPIIVDKDKIIIAGHTRYKAALKLGLAKVPVIIADDMTEAQVKAYRLADNKAGEGSMWDYDLLDAEMADIFDFDMTEYGFIGENPLFDDDTNVSEADDAEAGSLVDKFIVPPFSIFDTRLGYWQDRTRAWRELIQENAQARDGAKAYPGIKMSDKDSGVSILNPTLSEVIVSWYRPREGNKCFDPFAGDTVFGFVSAYMGMEFTGIEIRKEQVSFNQARVDEFDLPATYICDDGQNVAKHIPPASQDLLFSCPPYFDLEHYSDLPNDASNQESYEDFLAILDNAFTASIGCLKDDRFAVIVVGDIRDKKGAYRDFVGDVKRMFMDKGLALYNEIILINAVGTAAYRASSNMRNRKVVKVHQNILVFYKGDLAHIKDNFGPVEVMEHESEDE